jgi:hypothetical protein
MKTPCYACVLLLLAFSAPILAVDLSKIDRKIVKEPVYTSQPKYCLLVLGPEARTRVWLVQDGETLYVDRNGNGDLTEEGEKVVGQNVYANVVREGTTEVMYQFNFKVGEIREGNLIHQGLYVLTTYHPVKVDKQIKEYPAKDGYSVNLDVEMPGWKGRAIGGRVNYSAGTSDSQGFLRFADKPEDAPVIHFRGPWQMTLDKRQQMTVGRKATFTAVVGTPGFGPGTTARVDCGGLVPEDAFPTAEVVFPPAHAG